MGLRVLGGGGEVEEILDWTIGRAEQGLYFSATTRMIFIMLLMLPSEMSANKNEYVKSVCYVVYG